MGKPGAGKSTLIKFIHKSASDARNDNEIVIGFFFNARGDVLEKSITGMYRALLFDVLDYRNVDQLVVRSRYAAG